MAKKSLYVSLGILLLSFLIGVIININQFSSYDAKSLVNLVSSILSFSGNVIIPQALDNIMARIIYKNETLDPEVNMNTSEIIQYHGYPLEIHEVVTKDGYIITIQRIPFGKTNNSDSMVKRRPVLLMHGILLSSSCWICNLPDKNLAYLLADSGYDVWLANARGTKYGLNHVSLTSNDEKFWNFTFEEMAHYDIPAVIERILEKSSFKQIYYVGFSMGTTIIFVLLSTQPQYNEKIKAVFAIAPGARLEHTTSPLRLLRNHINENDKSFLNLIGTGEIGTAYWKEKFLNRPFGLPLPCKFCEDFIYIIAGYNNAQFNNTRLPVFRSHFPDGTSLKNLVHYNQIISSGHFRPFKGIDDTKIPSDYDLSKVTTPVELFWSQGDILTSSEDVSLLPTKLPNIVFQYEVTDVNFGHIEFLWGKDVKHLVYNKIIKEMIRLE